MVLKSSAYTLDWGESEVDSFNPSLLSATVTFNFLFNDDNIENIVIYCIGYLYWTLKNLPLSSVILVTFDCRGQHINIEVCEAVEKKIRKGIAPTVNNSKIIFKFEK